MIALVSVPSLIVRIAIVYIGYNIHRVQHYTHGLAWDGLAELTRGAEERALAHVQPVGRLLLCEEEEAGVYMSRSIDRPINRSVHSNTVRRPSIDR